jgi:methylglyoxal synthase
MVRKKKRIALIAHQNQMKELLNWAKFNCDFLAKHDVYATGTVVEMLTHELHLNVIQFQGEFHYNQELKTDLSPAETEFDFLVFLWDTSAGLPDDPNANALLQIALHKNIPIAGNRTAADFMFPLQMMSSE